MIWLPTTQSCELDDRDGSSRRRQQRPGATALEYLMMLSLILVAALTAIGYFGNITHSLTQSSATAITTSTKKGG